MFDKIADHLRIDATWPAIKHAIFAYWWHTFCWTVVVIFELVLKKNPFNKKNKDILILWAFSLFILIVFDIFLFLQKHIYCHVIKPIVFENTHYVLIIIFLVISNVQSSITVYISKYFLIIYVYLHDNVFEINNFLATEIF